MISPSSAFQNGFLFLPVCVCRLEEEKLKARALAQAAAQVQIQEEVKKVLEEKRAALQKSLKEAIMKERMNTEDERLIAQYYVRQFLLLRPLQGIGLVVHCKSLPF